MNREIEKVEAISWKTRYQNLMDSLNIGFLVCNLNFIIIDFNKKYLEMTGFTSSYLKGRHFSELYTKDEFERLKETITHHRKQDQYQYETILCCADGKRIPILNSSHINRDATGKPESVNVLVTDIRELKEIQTKLETAYKTLLSSQSTLKKEKRMIEAILFGIGDCVTIFDQKGKYILGSPQGIKIRGQRQFSLLPLESGSQKELVVQVGAEQRKFAGKIEAIKDEHGEIYAFAEILKDVTPIMRLRQREQELFHMKREMKREKLKSRLIGLSPAMDKVFDLIIRCTDVEFDVVIYGETGVGKGMVAQEIHTRSPRKDKPFIAVNCGALPESLLESELFGHVKGAFTGAISERTGLFRDAHEGIIFLDEIGDTSQALQVKLLRVFEEKEVRPIGSSRSYPIDVRIITATNKDLMQMADEGRFRADLYYRISVIPIYIPPLRERKEDILPLIEHFIGKHQDPKKKIKYFIDQRAQQILLEYSWPGNIRELENAIKHALAMARGSSITSRELPVQILTGLKPSTKKELGIDGFSIRSTEPEPTAGQNPKRLLSELSREFSESEKAMILSALRQNSGNRTQAAKDLGVSRTTLWRKIAMYRLNQ